MIENLGNRRHAFRLCADVDDDMGCGQLDDRSLDYMVVADCFLSLVLEVVQGRGEIVAGGCRSVRTAFERVIRRRANLMSCGVMRVVFMQFFMRLGVVRFGGNHMVRGGGLCVLGSVYYGRAAGVVVVCRCHGFKTGFKIAGGAVVEQIHSLDVDARFGAACGTWSSGLLVWSLGCVEADLADDPRTIPAGSKPRSNRDSSTITTASEQCQTRFWPMSELFTAPSH